jgi:hypothetical protein
MDGGLEWARIRDADAGLPARSSPYGIPIEDLRLYERRGRFPFNEAW